MDEKELRTLRAVAVAALALMVSGGTRGTALAQATAERASAFCGTINSEGAIQSAVAKCRAGDTVVIAKEEATVIARVCDFSKAIVESTQYIVCVVDRAVRERRP